MECRVPGAVEGLGQGTNTVEAGDHRRGRDREDRQVHQRTTRCTAGATAVNTANAGNPTKFVTALLKNNGQTTFALKGGNAQTGALSTWYSGNLPAGYSPMHEGSIVLGTGGDNSNRGTQSFYEGVMTAGYSTDAADNAVQSNVVSVGYTGVSSGGGPGSTIVGPGGKCVDVAGDDTGGNTAVVQLYDCRQLAADQHWSGSAYGRGTLGTLGRCLGLSGNGTANGTRVELEDCTGNGAQQWIPQANGSLRNPQSGRCLDDPSGNTANGTALQLYDCNGNSAQVFTVTGGHRSSARAGSASTSRATTPAATPRSSSSTTA